MVSPKKLNSGNQYCFGSYLVHFGSLLQNTTKVYYEMRQVFLLKSRTILLQNATVIRKFVDFITKYGSRYKMRRLLQNASLQGPRLAQTLKNRNLIA